MIQQNSDQDIIIVGGGIIGLTLASLLAQSSMNIAVVDRQAMVSANWQLKQPYDLRVSAINAASLAIWQSLGLLPAINQLRSSSYQRMEVWDANSPARIHFDCTEVAQPYLGHIIEHSVLMHVLGEYLRQQANVKLLPLTEITELLTSEQQVAIKLANGNYLSARLLIGADGSNSWVAQQAKFAVNRKAYDQSALVTTLRLERNHQRCAWQRFLTDGVLAFLPLADPHWVSVVWSTTHQQAQYLQQLTPNDFNQQIAQAMEYRFGTIETIDQRLLVPLVQKHACDYVKPRLALIGDAAHTVHPLAGQGVNLGLADAKCLAEILLTTRAAGRDIGAILALRPYERARKSENTIMMMAINSFKVLFSQQQEIFRHVRAAAFLTAEKLPLIKRYFMQQAMGN